MHDIFVSYDRENRGQVRPVVEALELHGWQVWWDETISPGQDYSQVIEDALDAARCVIVVWTSQSVTSYWCRMESREGLNRNVLIPLQVEADLRIPLEFRGIQMVNLIGWQGEPDHPEFSRLIQGVTALIGAPAPTVNEPEVEPEVEPDVSELSDELPPVVPVERETAEPPRPKPTEFQPIQNNRVAPGVSKPLLISGAVVVVVAVLAYFYFVRLEPTPSPPVKSSSPKTIQPLTSSPPKTITNSIGMTFALIPARTFQMGSEGPNADDDEKPVHPVRISQVFYLGITEVTQEHWKAIMGKDNNPSNFKGNDLPVETVYWNDAQEFIQQLNAKEGGEKYRLPRESEWEYAARAGTSTAYSFGDDASELGEYAWYDGNSGGKTHPVRGRKANGWGLYDMHGNVWEWVQDWYGEYTGSTAGSSAVDPTGPVSGALRVVRGGSWDFTARSCRSSYRSRLVPGYRSRYVGFRVLRLV